MKRLINIHESMIVLRPGTIPIRTANENKCEGKFYYRCYSIMVFVIVFALLLGTAGACVAFARSADSDIEIGN